MCSDKEIAKESKLKDSYSSRVAYYLDKFKEKQKNQDGQILNSRLIFRGHANVAWNVVSSAGRRLHEENQKVKIESKDRKEEKKKIEVKQSDYIRYHVNLIANARKYGYGGLSANSNLNDLEMLAEIQHYGGATCLTDFSTNFLTALWFASEDSQKIKQMAAVSNSNNITTMALLGALKLYLDFINLFLRLLRLFGKRN